MGDDIYLSEEDQFKMDGETTIVLELLSGRYTGDGRRAKRLADNLYSARWSGLFANDETALDKMLYEEDETTNEFSLNFFLLRNGRFTVPHNFSDTALGVNGILLPAISKSDRLLLEFGNEKLRVVVEKEEKKERMVQVPDEKRSILLRKGIHLYIRLFLSGALDICKEVMGFLTNEISEASEQEQYSGVQWHEIPYILALLSGTTEKCLRFGFGEDRKKVYPPGSISKACIEFSRSGGLCRRGGNCPYLHDRRLLLLRKKMQQILY